MTTIKLGDNAAAQFAGVTDLAEVTDAAGRVVGFFAPVEREHAARYAAAAAQIYPHKDDHKATEDGKRYTTAEVLQHLESLEKK